MAESVVRKRPNAFRTSRCGQCSDNRLLGAFHHLPLVLTSGTGGGGESVVSVGLHVEQFQQCGNRH